GAEHQHPDRNLERASPGQVAVPEILLPAGRFHVGLHDGIVSARPAPIPRFVPRLRGSSLGRVAAPLSAGARRPRHRCSIAPPAATAMIRRHDIDALRVFAFGLLIAYHLGMVYVADWGYHVKSAHQAEWLQWPMIALNRWRMPLLFMISGVALGLAMASRPPGRLLVSRSWRLLLPLAFGMLVIVPVQAYCEALANGAIEPGFGAFMARYLQLRPW